jgi:hypothetical protein
MKKYIFIPVNLSLHWSLCVVVNPGAILNEVGPTCEETMDDELFPCLLFFDSLKAHKKIAITQNVRKWLNSEWQRLEKPKTENAEDAVNPFNKNTMDVFTPRGTLIWQLNRFVFALCGSLIFRSSPLPRQQLGLWRVCMPIRLWCLPPSRTQCHLP